MAAAIATCERSLDSFAAAGQLLDTVIAMTAYADALAGAGRHEEAGDWARRATAHNRASDGTLRNPGYEIDNLLTLAGKRADPARRPCRRCRDAP